MSRVCCRQRHCRLRLAHAGAGREARQPSAKSGVFPSCAISATIPCVAPVPVTATVQDPQNGIVMMDNQMHRLQNLFGSLPARYYNEERGAVDKSRFCFETRLSRGEKARLPGGVPGGCPGVRISVRFPKPCLPVGASVAKTGLGAKKDTDMTQYFYTRKGRQHQHLAKTSSSIDDSAFDRLRNCRGGRSGNPGILASRWMVIFHIRTRWNRFEMGFHVHTTARSLAWGNTAAPVTTAKALPPDTQCARAATSDPAFPQRYAAV